MFKRAINKDGKTVHIDDYPTREAAHADKPFTDTNHIGLKLTPVITDEKECHFRVVSGCTNSTGGGPMRPEHFITQKMFERIFNSKEEFWVKYRRFPGPKYKHAWTKLDLKRHYDTCIVEGRVDDWQADVLLKDSTGLCPDILVEVWFKHRCEPEKIKSGHLIIEFKIRSFDDIFKRIHSWGLIEDEPQKMNYNVRFFNFRERTKELPWPEKGDEERE